MQLPLLESRMLINANDYICETDICRAASTAAENVSRRILPIANLLAGGRGDGQASADAR